MGWTGPRNISVNSISGSHAVEKGRKVPRRYVSAPIYVKPTLFGYRIHDGNARLGMAKAAGQRTIRAYVWK